MRLLLAQVLGEVMTEYRTRLGAAVTDLLGATIANLGLRKVSACAEGRHAGSRCAYGHGGSAGLPDERGRVTDDRLLLVGWAVVVDDRRSAPCAGASL